MNQIMSVWNEQKEMLILPGKKYVEALSGIILICII
jgi:hypothetical protein